jgi:hypothetical protein
MRKTALVLATVTVAFALITSAQAQSDTACCRNIQTGDYKTIKKGDIVPDKARWKSVHAGKCTKCEGKNVLNCQEPGDSEAQGLSHKH